MTFQVTVKDPSGQPIQDGTVGANVQETGAMFSRHTDGNGYADLNMGATPIGSHVTFWIGEGCKIQSPPYGVVTSTDQPIAMTVAPSFKTPSRARLCAVKAPFQGLDVTLPGYGTIPYFGGFINSLDADGRRIVRQAERGWGATHAYRQLSYAYNDGGYVYPIPGADFTQRLPEFRARLLEDLAAGIWPVVELAGDGLTYDPNGGCYGWRWLMDNLERILDGLNLDDRCVFLHSWEELNYNGWNTDMLFEITLLHRQLRPNAYIAWHSSYAWPGDGEGRSGPVEAWNSPAGQSCDVMLGEGDAPFLQLVNGTYEPLPGNALNGWQQRAWCWLGPQANAGMIAPENKTSPFYWESQTPRGPRYAVACELDLYRYSRGLVSQAEIEAEQAYVTALGFPFHG